MKIRSIILWLILAIIAVPFLFGLIYQTELFLGYYPGYPGWKVGEIARVQKDVSLCKKIIGIPWKGILSPTVGESRISCVYEYAKLAKDPTACELLMPSSYGWSCLGGAQATAEACNVDGDISVSWPLGEDTLGEWKTVTMQKCKQKVVTDKVGKDCCFILEITGDSSIDSCKRFEGNPHFMNSCIAQLALKKKDENICTVISDENKKSMCEVQARTVRKFNTIENL